MYEGVYVTHTHCLISFFFILTDYFCCSVAKLCPTLCDPVHPGFTVFHHLPEFLKLMSIESVILSSHLIFCCPFLFLLSIFPSIRVFSNESVLCTRWPKYWSFSFSISLSNEYSHHSSKASILWHSAFFIVQLSHPYITTGKTIALTKRTFVGKVCLCFLKCYLGWS